MQPADVADRAALPRAGEGQEGTRAANTQTAHFDLPQPLRYPLGDLDIRITYRTLRVLSAIAALGGRGADPSNREIADHAGITDPGQISKLLTRLEKHKLVHNSGDDQAKGERNAWTLTPKGEEVERATRARDGG